MKAPISLLCLSTILVPNSSRSADHLKASHTGDPAVEPPSIEQARPDRDGVPHLVMFTGFGYGYSREVVAPMEQAIGFGRHFLEADDAYNNEQRDSITIEVPTPLFGRCSTVELVSASARSKVGEWRVAHQ